MGNSGAATPSRTEKASSFVLEQTGIHVYPGWATMQAYYAPGVAMPPPYFSSIVTPGHTPHPYSWGPQLVMPPFGSSHSAIYPHGFYSHSSEFHGVHAAVTSSTASEVTTVLPEAPVKSPNSKDNSLVKNFKGPDRLAVSVCNGIDEKGEGSVADALSQSSESGTKGSSKGSDGNNVEADNQMQGKRVSEDTAAAKVEQKAQDNQTQGKRFSEHTAAGKVVDSDSMTRMEVGISNAAKPKIVAQDPSMNKTFAHDCDPVRPGQWVQDERELKRERRKQSNRESARRSRLKKQAETEELAKKVKVLSVENLTLKSEISQLTNDSAKLRQENSALMDKLKHLMSVRKADYPSEEMETKKSPSAGTESFLLQ